MGKKGMPGFSARTITHQRAVIAAMTSAYLHQALIDLVSGSEPEV